MVVQQGCGADGMRRVVDPAPITTVTRDVRALENHAQRTSSASFAANSHGRTVAGWEQGLQEAGRSTQTRCSALGPVAYATSRAAIQPAAKSSGSLPEGVQQIRQGP